MCFSASAAVDEKSYVQDGLYAQWDGVVNAGYDESGNPIHDPNASTWVDLTGHGHTLTSGDAAWPWDADALHFTADHTAIKPCFSGELDYTSLTIDFYCYGDEEKPSGHVFYTAPFYYDEAAKKWRDASLYFSTKFNVGVATAASSLNSTTGGRGGHAAVYDDLTVGLWYQGRTPFPSATQALTVLPDSSGERTFYVGASKDNGNQFRGKLHSLRIYTRPLTEDEANWNNAIDKIRFGGGNTPHKLSVVSSVGADYGTPTPAYGTPAAIEGGEQTFSIAGLAGFDDGARGVPLDAGVRARFDGWSFEKGKKGTSLYASLSGTDESVVLTTEFLTSTFTWEFVREIKVSVSSEHGTVALNDGVPTAGLDAWCGEAYTLKAVPDEGYAFSMWSGETAGIDDLSSAEITVASDLARNLTAVFVADDREPITWQWQGGASGEWSDPANWGGGVPITGDSVVINPEGDATIVIGGPTPRLKTVIVGNSGEGTTTLRMEGWDTCLNADEVRVAAGGRIATVGAHFDASPVSNRVWIAADALTVAAGGAITADGAGFEGTNGPCWKVVRDNNVATHSGSFKGWFFGAAYGGAQGYETSEYFPYAPQPYGSLEEPTDLGSGGNKESCSGGGAIRLDVSGDLVIDGVVSANARDADKKVNGERASYGSGGSVWITCETLSGTGRVSACSRSKYAGETPRSAGSSGGRIAVHYDAAQQALVSCGVAFDARGGVPGISAPSSTTGYVTRPGMPGTLYFTDDAFAGNDIAGEYHSGATGPLTLSGGERPMPQLYVPNRDVVFDSALVVTGVYAGASLLGVSNATLTVKGNLTARGVRILVAGGTAVVEGSCALSAQSAAATATGADIVLEPRMTNAFERYGAELIVSGKLTLGAGTRLLPKCNQTDGAIACTTARKMTIESGATVNASCAGWAIGHGPSCGGGKNPTSGAGHGGKGGDAYWSGKVSASGSPARDDEFDPLEPGSGASVENANYVSNTGPGGGVVRLNIEKTLTVNGTITANGNPTVSSSVRASGSAGGSVNIDARKLEGDGTITALGGAGNPAGGNGGGGRIAFFVSTCPWFGDTSEHVSVKAGVMSATVDYPDGASGAEDGTVYWGPFRGRSYGLMLQVR